MSPTQRTRAYLKEQGFFSTITEKWNPHARKRQDMFGFIDLVYLTDCQIVAVQVTSGTNHASRKSKIIKECKKQASQWILCEGKIELWSWSKRKVKRGGKAMRWTPRIEEIVIEDFI